MYLLINHLCLLYTDVKDSVDFCSYWFRLAHQNLPENRRADLVGTNSISQGKSRTAALDYIAQNNGVIHDAISTQEWSGEAAVHISIVNWIKPGRIQQPQLKFFLDDHQVTFINSSLKAQVDVTMAKRLKANQNKCFQRVIPVGKGFIITEQQVQAWVKADPKNQEVLKLFSRGSNLAQNPHGLPERWIINFSDMTIEEIMEYKFPSAWVREKVKPERDFNREAVMREKWWRFKRTNKSIRTALKSLSYYFTVPRVSK